MIAIYLKRANPLGYIVYSRIFREFSWTKLKMESASSSSNSVTNYQLAQCYIPENCIII